MTALAFAPTPDASRAGALSPASRSAPAMCLAVGLEDGSISLWSSDQHDRPSSARTAESSPSARSSRSEPPLRSSSAGAASTDGPASAAASPAQKGDDSAAATLPGCAGGKQQQVHDPAAAGSSSTADQPSRLDHDRERSAQSRGLSENFAMAAPHLSAGVSSPQQQQQLQLVWQSPVALCHCAAVRRLAWHGPGPHAHPNKKPEQLEGSMKGSDQLSEGSSGTAPWQKLPLLASCGDDHSVRIFSVCVGLHDC